MGYASRYFLAINPKLHDAIPDFELADIDQDFYRLQQIFYGHTGTCTPIIVLLQDGSISVMGTNGEETLFLTF
jgi:hypothetical protein